MAQEKTKEQPPKSPNPQETDRVLAQVIGWTANLIGMVRKFPQSRERDQTVFTTRKILRSLRSLRGEKVRPFVPGEERKPAEKKIVVKKEEVKKKEEKKVKPKKVAPKKKVIKKKAPKPKPKKEEKVIFKKEPPKPSK